MFVTKCFEISSNIPTQTPVTNTRQNWVTYSIQVAIHYTFTCKQMWFLDVNLEPRHFILEFVTQLWGKNRPKNFGFANFQFYYQSCETKLGMKTVGLMVSYQCDNETKSIIPVTRSSRYRYTTSGSRKH